MSKYDHKKIEKKWQKEWEKSGIYKTRDFKKNKDNFYSLVEFPYPSGDLHVGHWYAFSVPDIFARKKRMGGFNVLYPIGFDAFGLPAENAAIKRGINPKKWTYDNIDFMRKQLRSMGTSFDWSREVVTSDKDYYKWTQWLFLQFLKNNLAYQADTEVNWCLSCKTVLANEQVVNGKCERCGNEVTQRKMKQWMLKITDYAERLLFGLKGLGWKNEIKDAQREWIGKSEGALIKFQITNPKFQINSKSQIPNSKQFIEVFTTRPDTIFGATYLILAPEYPLISNLKSQISNWNEIEKYIENSKKKTELERKKEEKKKTGVELKGIKAINPANKEEIPIWVADYVLGSYGTGAIMAVPAHDQRDFEFAKKFNLLIKMVVCPHYPAPICPVLDKAYLGEGHLVDSGKFDGMKSEEAKKKITEFVGGKTKIQYRLRDWVVSRQRYWGCPIPVIHCGKCGVVGVLEKDLPVELPEIKDYKPTGDGKSPLAKVEKWVKVKCPQCGENAERETDTLDTFVDSSWYFLRYTDTKNKKEFASKEKIKNWLPVKLYSGGAEHTTMHLLYSRFFIKAMHDFGLLDFDEPYVERRNRGIVLGPDGQKMSKSRGNVVNPDEYVEKFGADTVRMYLAFIGPYNEVGSYPWNTHGVLGIKRFLDRVYNLKHKTQNTKHKQNTKPKNTNIEKLLHKTIKKVTEDIENFRFNTAISALMILLNEMEKQAYGIRLTAYGIFLKLLAPFAPHITEEIWHQLGNKKSIHIESWPKYDPKLIEDDTFELIVQINGKIRDKFEVPVSISQKEAETLTFSREKVKNILGSSQSKKVIFVPNRLINLVI